MTRELKEQWWWLAWFLEVGTVAVNGNRLLKTLYMRAWEFMRLTKLGRTVELGSRSNKRESNEVRGSNKRESNRIWEVVKLGRG